MLYAYCRYAGIAGVQTFIDLSLEFAYGVGADVIKVICTLSIIVIFYQ